MHLGRLATDGTVKRIRRGKFDLCLSVRGYIGHLREAQKEAERSVDPHVLALAKAKTREYVARAMGLEARNRQMAGELVTVDEIIQVLSTFLAAARERILGSGLPGHEKEQVLKDLCGILEAAAQLHESDSKGNGVAAHGGVAHPAAAHQLPGVGRPAPLPLP